MSFFDPGTVTEFTAGGFGAPSDGGSLPPLFWPETGPPPPPLTLNAVYTAGAATEVTHAAATVVTWVPGKQADAMCLFSVTGASGDTHWFGWVERPGVPRELRALLTGRLLGTALGPNGVVAAATIPQNNDAVISVSLDAKTRLAEQMKGDVQSVAVAWTDDGRLIVMVRECSGECYVACAAMTLPRWTWQWQTKLETAPSSADPADALMAVRSRNSRVLAYVGSSHAVLLDATNGACAAEVTLPDGLVDAAFSEDGREFAVLGHRSTLRRFAATTGAEREGTFLHLPPTDHRSPTDPADDLPWSVGYTKHLVVVAGPRNVWSVHTADADAPPTVELVVADGLSGDAWVAPIVTGAGPDDVAVVRCTGSRAAADNMFWLEGMCG
jgi:hypothetical protein